MLDAGGGEIADAASERRVPSLPILLLAAAADRLVERADTLQSSPADRHVRRPDELDVTIGRSAVEGGDRGSLPAARVRPALDHGGDRPSEHVDVRSSGDPVE